MHPDIYEENIARLIAVAQKYVDDFTEPNTGMLNVKDLKDALDAFKD